jgi:hypothetical protein
MSRLIAGKCGACRREKRRKMDEIPGFFPSFSLSFLDVFAFTVKFFVSLQLLI